jgi:hypothetical protein
MTLGTGIPSFQPLVRGRKALHLKKAVEIWPSNFLVIAPLAKKDVGRFIYYIRRNLYSGEIVVIRWCELPY